MRQLTPICEMRWVPCRGNGLGGSVWAGSHGDAFVSGETFFRALDRDVTLTGRTTLWDLAIEDGLERPWLGYGYRAYWHTPGGPGEEVGRRIEWFAASGHNGFLDLWLELGIVGLVLFAVVFGGVAYRAFRRFKLRRDALGLWYAVFLGYLLIASVPHSAILARNNISWVIFVVTAYHVLPARTEQRPEKPPQPTAARGVLVVQEGSLEHGRPNS